MQTTMRLRNRISAKDDSFILQLINENLSQYQSSSGMTDKKIIHKLNQYSRVLLFCQKNGAAIGFISWTEQEATLLIELCVLDKKYQGQGILTAHAAKIERFALRNHFKKIRFYVDRQNLQAQSLYKRLGFHPIKTNFFTGSILMEKKLE